MDREYSLNSFQMDAVTDVFYALYEEGMMFLNMSVSSLLQFCFICVKLSCMHLYVAYGLLILGLYCSQSTVQFGCPLWALLFYSSITG
jgi:hypothetical protein